MPTPGEILLSLLHHGDGVDSLPETLCRRAAEDLSADGVGLTLLSDGGHRQVLAATAGTARVVEELQVTAGEGPSLDAWRERRVVLLSDVARVAPARWPGLAPALLEAGVRAIFVFPLQVGDIRLGVLDVCRTTPGRLEREQLATGLTYAEVAVTVLLHLQEEGGLAAGLDGRLLDPLASAPQIHQATGMISVQAAVGLAEALLLLRAHAFVHSRSARDVARDVVNRTLHFYPDNDGEAER
ncbi:GAF domain-containing protein [Nocardioides ginsengisegetis]|uniref:GAF domain-containing protein n=1 Tax=Nocardioides ginsengisegetis TaxID=661491 RepID=A0A7W3J334_9ACTN|nr:GAF domain-containing protein [Nocardioides ginsengisegetis]MBA8805427.1 GAF domain-containing protein [Nocardioides ginsengisegetis]